MYKVCLFYYSVLFKEKGEYDINKIQKMMTISLKKLYIYVHIYVYTNLCVTCNLLMALFHKFSRAIKLHTSNEINTEKSFYFVALTEMLPMVLILFHFLV